MVCLKRSLRRIDGLRGALEQTLGAFTKHALPFQFLNIARPLLDGRFEVFVFTGTSLCSSTTG